LKKNIIIIGGSFFNKGAEAMTYAVVDQLKQNHPDSNIVLFDYHPTLTEEHKQRYAFEIVELTFPHLFRLTRSVGIALSGSFIIKKNIKKLLGRGIHIKVDMKKIVDILSNTELIVDISGYGLSAHYQPLIESLAYLMNIKLAQLFNIPYIILPQTLGHFKFSYLKGIFLTKSLLKYIHYPKYIFTREIKSFGFVREIRKANVFREPDIVLQTGKYNLENIFKTPPASLVQRENIGDNYIVVIPNIRLTKITSEKIVMRIYSSVIKAALSFNRRVVILRHSMDDCHICNKLKSLYTQQDVILMNENYYPFELENIISNSEIVISSRYHGLVHAMENNVPVIAIGWADKYADIMKELGLEKYNVDVNKAVDALISDRIRELLRESNDVRAILHKKITAIQKNNILLRYNI